MVNARTLVTSLVGRPLRTMGRARPNRILRVEDDQAIVETEKSPAGRPVPIAMVQAALDILERDGVVEIDVATVGHRSAFVGAVLRELDGVVVGARSIRRAR